MSRFWTFYTSLKPGPFSGVCIIMLGLVVMPVLHVQVMLIKRALLRYVRAHAPGCRIVATGAVWIDPKYLGLWVKTQTDAQRDTIKQHPELRAELLSLAARYRYPAHAIAGLGLACESQETVDRDFAGSWPRAMA